MDVQNDFCEGGSLAIKSSNEVIPVINELKKNARFSKIIFTRDWHPKDHCSFAENNKGARLYETITLPDT